jgi:hypothetical protein
MKTGYLALAPAFESSAAGIVPIDRVHVILTRVADETVALDDTIAVDPESQTVDLTLSVAVHGAEEAFYLTIECLNSAGEVVFVGGPLEVTATTSTDSELVTVEVPIVYVGVGYLAAAVEMVTSLIYIEFGETVTLEAQALDSSGAVIPGTPIKWISEDPDRVSVPDPAVGRIVGGSERGWVHVEAQLLTGQSALADVFVEPVPSVIAVVSGDGQTGSVDVELSQPLVVEVRAVDGPVADVTVEFATPDGGSFGQASVATDSEGLASTTWTLGPTEGAQSATATVIDVSGVQVAFTATAVVPGEPRLGFTVQPSNAEQGQVITPAVEVTAFDDLGSVDVNFTGDVTLAVANNPGDGTLSGTTTVAAVSGVALFDDMSIDLAGVGYTLQATALGYTPSTSAAFNITAAPAQGGISWTGAGGDSNWSNPNNWDLGRVPAPTDTAFITLQGDYMVSVDVDVTVAFLFLEVPLAIASGQTLAIDSSATVGTFGELQLGSGATLTGPGDVVIDGILSWGGGTVAGTGLLSVSSAGLLNINAGNQVVLDGRTIQNVGDLLWMGGDIVMDDGAQITNNGVMNMQSDFVIDWGGTGTEPRIVNNGSLIQSDMVTTIYIPVDNNGTINVTSGSLDLRGATTHSGAAITVGAASGSPTISFQDGAHTLDAGTTLQVGTNGRVRFPSGTTAVAGSYDQSGAGSSTDISGGTVTFDGGNAATIRRLDLSSGSLGGTGTIVVTDSIIWRGGILQGAGVTRIADTGVMWMLGGSKALDQRTIDNAGTIVWESGNVTATNGAQLNNLGGAMFEMQAGDTFGGTGSFQNAGTFLYSNTGVGSFGLALGNTGTLDLDGQAGGILALTGQFTHQSTGIIQGNGTLDLTAANVPTFDGRVNPGTSPGIVNIAGDVVMSSLTAANIELGGLNVGTEYDQLNVSGAISIDGTLNVTLINGFTPAIGNTFRVLTFTSRSGEFADTTGIDLGGGLALDLVWNATSLDLVVTDASPAPTEQIVFFSDSGGGLDLAVVSVSADGGGLSRVADTGVPTSYIITPRWSPDRQRVAFSHDASGATSNLYMVTAAGGDLTEVVNNINSGYPRWSHNSQHLGFVCVAAVAGVNDFCALPDVTGAISSIPQNGYIVASASLPAAWRAGPTAAAWDPVNQSRYVFARDSTDGVSPAVSRFFSADYDGGNLTTITPGVMNVGNGELRVEAMDLSPDGSTIVFSAYDRSSPWTKLYVVNSNGTGLRQLTFLQGYDDTPLFSPDGTEVLFGRDDNCFYNYWIVDINNTDGSLERQITDDNFYCEEIPYEQVGYDWSPDGSQIALIGFDDATGWWRAYVVPSTVTVANYRSVRVLVGRDRNNVGPWLREYQPNWRP